MNKGETAKKPSPSGEGGTTIGCDGRGCRPPFYADRRSGLYINNFGKYIKAKVKFYVGLSDVTCYPITQFSLYNNIVAEKDLKTYQNYGHEDLPGAVDEAIMFFGE